MGNINPEDRIGMINTMNDGSVAKIINYIDNKHLTIEFLDNGDILENIQFGHFKRGNVNRKRLYKKQREGQVFKLNCGWKIKITKYINAMNVTAKVLETGEIIKNLRYDHLKNGDILPRTFPTVSGHGYLGEEEDVDANSKCYKTWNHMLERCFSDKLKEKHPTYKDVTVCKDWLNYSNFKSWFEYNYYEINNETMALDKDILVKGNKLYSPETCVFVSSRINNLFTKNNSKRSKYYIGVNYRPEINSSNPYCASCGNTKGDQIYLGYFKTPEEAFYAYKEFKEKYIKQIADEYKQYIPQKLYDAMYRYEVDITD